MFREGFGELLFALLALADPDVPGTHLGVTGIVLRVGGQGLCEILLCLAVLLRLGVDLPDPEPVARVRLATHDPIDESLALGLVPREVVHPSNSEQLP